tara:strand:+ start:169 stop:411 length:243 start_codon:yes stop_codon:yes gene_type:complete
MTSNNNERKNTMTHITSIFGTMYGGFEAEIEKDNREWPAHIAKTFKPYKITVKHNNRTIVSYSNTEAGCESFLANLKETW